MLASFMNRNIIINTILLALLSIFFQQCKVSHTCLEQWPNEVKYDRWKPFISIDSISKSEEGCEYYVSTNMSTTGTSLVWNALMYQSDNVYYFRWLEPKSNEFILFDLNAELNRPYKASIQYSDSLFKTLDCELERIILFHNEVEVYVFHIKDIYNYYHGDEFLSSLDVMFFVTAKHGVIGSYFTTTNLDGTEVLISPAGEILQDYIDYSNMKIEKIL